MARMISEATRPFPRERLKRILSELADLLADWLEELQRSSAKPPPGPAAIHVPAQLPNVEKVSSYPKMLRLREVCERTGLSRSSIYKYIQDEIFPPPRKLGYRIARWLSSDIDEWMQRSYSQQPARKGRGALRT